MVVARHFWASSAALATSSAKTYLFQKSPDHQCQLGFQLVECCPTATLLRRESECLHSPSLREARRIPTHELLQPSMSQYVGPAKFVAQSPFGYGLRFQTAAFGYPWHGLFVRSPLLVLPVKGRTHSNGFSACARIPFCRKFGTTPAQDLIAKTPRPQTGPPRALMQKSSQARVCFWRDCYQIALFSLLLSISCVKSRGQAATEVAGSTSVSSSTATSAKQLGFSATDLPQNKNKTPHLAIPPGPAPEAVNRQALELRAGPDAGKLLLRSLPSSAQVWIDGVAVGHTPMLLILTPGKYEVELRGQRLERAKRSIDLLPHETREVALTLAAHYPTRATIR